MNRFRVEQEKIERQLLKHPSIESVLVLEIENIKKEKKVIVYVVKKPTKELSSRQLSQFLHKNLPNSMLHSTIIFLKSFPLTENKEINYKKLPLPTEINTKTNKIMPFSRLEKSIANIWSSILGITNIGIHDSLFELGCNSIQLAEIADELRKQKFSFTIKDLLRYSTIEEFIIFHQSQFFQNNN